MRGSYARYVGQIQETIAGSGASSNGSPASYYYFWQGAPINETCGQPGGTCTGTAQVLQTMFNGIGVAQTGVFPTLVQPDIVNLPGVNQQIINPLKSPNANEYSLGFGGTLGANFVYRVDAVRREFKDFYALERNLNTGFVSDALGNQYNLGVFVNSNNPERNYTALNASSPTGSGCCKSAATGRGRTRSGTSSARTPAAAPFRPRCSTTRVHPGVLEFSEGRPRPGPEASRSPLRDL